MFPPSSKVIGCGYKPNAILTTFSVSLFGGALRPIEVKTQAQTIVAENISDFPAELLGKLNLTARTADEFIADIIALAEGLAIPASATCACA
jgi:hypothetical protein